MIKEYEIKHEPIVYEGNNLDKYNIYYYEDGEEVFKAFHSTDGKNSSHDIWPGYRRKGEPNWRGLKENLKSDPLFMRIYEPGVNGIAYQNVTKYITDGEMYGNANEAEFKIHFDLLNISWTNEQKTTINQYLTTNNFTIQIA